MDLDKLSTGDKVIAGSAIAYFIFMFFPWFEAEVAGVATGVDRNGFDVGFLWGFFPLLLAILMVVIVALRAFSPDTQLPELPITYGQLLMGLGGLAAFLVILKLLIGEDFSAQTLVSVSGSRQFGLFLATFAAIGLAVGGFLRMQEEAGQTSGTV